jgi:hypothetical protein
MDSPGRIILVLAGIAVAVVSIIWHFSRSNSLLQQWAERNGYRIVEQDYRSFLKGPFFFIASKNQTVYRVVVEDKDGRRRTGWVRCGGWFLGLWSDTVEVRWDD